MTEHIVPQPHTAICVVCMKRKQCIHKRIMASGELRQYDQFFYSEEHRGWMCKKCKTQLEKTGSISEGPEILKHEKEPRQENDL